MEIAKSWEFLEMILGGDTEISQTVWKPVSPSAELKNAVLFLAQPGIPSLLESWLCDVIFNNLSDVVGPAFWSQLSESQTDPAALCEAMDFLYGIYEGQYMEAVQRMASLYKLAACAPATQTLEATSMCTSSSAFTPVKAGLRTTKHPAGGGKTVCFEAQPNSQTSLTPNTGQLAAPAGAGRGVKIGDATLWEEGNCGKQLCTNTQQSVNMDGSYIPANDSLNMEQALSQNTSTLSFQDKSRESDNKTNFLRPEQPAMEDEDDEESFIRSPIGGNKKLMVSSATPGFQSGTPFIQPSSTSIHAHPSLRATSHTSTPGLVLTTTPGLVLTTTPGPFTPIATEETPDVFNKVSDDSCMETPSLLRESVYNKSELPDASVVFGCPVSSRPAPGKLVSHPFSPAALVNKVKVMIKSVLFYTYPKKFSVAIKDIYTWAFGVYKGAQDESVDEDSSSDIEMDIDKFNRLNNRMDEMGLMELISGSAVTEIVHTQIEKHIDEECKGNFDTSYIKHLETWLDDQVLGWLKDIYARKNTASQVASFNAFRDRLRQFIYEKYGRSLISQFFDIIIDFPDSKPAIQDLTSCLEKADLRSELVSSLKNSLESRLLHPGVTTAVILTAYIAAIKSLRLLEPAGVILELVCEPVGRYLRSREDTVRCIVASLTDDSNNELVSELVNTKPVSEETDEEDSSRHPIRDDWEPDPVDADPSSGSKFRRSADILSTLVNIYGSKELFVNEYRALLADRILTQYNYDVERELRYLELLKLRFGEAQLHFCEVMLRDVAESRRVNTRIQEDAKKAMAEQDSEAEKEELELSAMILSAQYWPAFRDEKIKLPSELQEHLDKYTKSFEQQKQNRTLVWKPHLGVMNIDLELNGETLSFSVSPVQAAIIMKFQERKEWSLEALSEELEMTPTVLRRKLAFWQTQGLIRESADNGSASNKQQMYSLIEEPRGARGGHHDLIAGTDIEEEVESAMASAQEQKEEEMQILWTYIQGMLANLDCLPLERIHAMLRMFATEEPGSELSLQQLKTFLDGKVRDQILIFSSGVYRINK